MVQADAQRISEIYRHSGRYDVRVTPEIIEQANNRVDLVFTIDEGGKTGVKSVDFVGNTAFSSYRLRDVIKTHEANLLSFLGGGDIYDPDRVEADRDLLRRFYLKNGYADFDVRDAKAELSPDRKAFFLTFTISEGERYRVGKITINSQLRNLSGDDLRPDLQFDEGDWYDGDAVGRTADAMELDVHTRGYAFVDVKPRVTRDREKHIIDLAFDVGEGPRVYVERIDIVGGTMTTLIYELRRRGGGRGLATLCLGGGEAVAMAVEV